MKDKTYPGYKFEGLYPSTLSRTVDVHSQTPPLHPFPPFFVPPVVALMSQGNEKTGGFLNTELEQLTVTGANF